MGIDIIEWLYIRRITQAFIRISAYGQCQKRDTMTRQYAIYEFALCLRSAIRRIRTSTFVHWRQCTQLPKTETQCALPQHDKHSALMRFADRFAFFCSKAMNSRVIWAYHKLTLNCNRSDLVHGMLRLNLLQRTVQLFDRLRVSTLTKAFIRWREAPINSPAVFPAYIETTKDTVATRQFISATGNEIVPGTYENSPFISATDNEMTSAAAAKLSIDSTEGILSCKSYQPSKRLWTMDISKQLDQACTDSFALRDRSDRLSISSSAAYFAATGKDLNRLMADFSKPPDCNTYIQHKAKTNSPLTRRRLLRAKKVIHLTARDRKRLKEFIHMRTRSALGFASVDAAAMHNRELLNFHRFSMSDDGFPKRRSKERHSNESEVGSQDSSLDSHYQNNLGYMPTHSTSINGAPMTRRLPEYNYPSSSRISDKTVTLGGETRHVSILSLSSDGVSEAARNIIPYGNNYIPPIYRRTPDGVHNTTDIFGVATLASRPHLWESRVSNEGLYNDTSSNFSSMLVDGPLPTSFSDYSDLTGNSNVGGRLISVFPFKSVSLRNEAAKIPSPVGPTSLRPPVLSTSGRTSHYAHPSESSSISSTHPRGRHFLPFASHQSASLSGSYHSCEEGTYNAYMQVAPYSSKQDSGSSLNSRSSTHGIHPLRDFLAKEDFQSISAYCPSGVTTGTPKYSRHHPFSYEVPKQSSHIRYAEDSTGDTPDIEICDSYDQCLPKAKLRCKHINDVSHGATKFGALDKMTRNDLYSSAKWNASVGSDEPFQRETQKMVTGKDSQKMYRAQLANRKLSQYPDDLKNAVVGSTGGSYIPLLGLPEIQHGRGAFMETQALSAAVEKTLAVESRQHLLHTIPSTNSFSSKPSKCGSIYDSDSRNSVFLKEPRIGHSGIRAVATQPRQHRQDFHQGVTVDATLNEELRLQLQNLRQQRILAI